MSPGNLPPEVGAWSSDFNEESCPGLCLFGRNQIWGLPRRPKLLTKLGQSRSNSGRVWRAACGLLWAVVILSLQPGSARLQPESAEAGPNLAKLGQTRPDWGQGWSNLGRMSALGATLGQRWAQPVGSLGAASDLAWFAGGSFQDIGRGIPGPSEAFRPKPSGAFRGLRRPPRPSQAFPGLPRPFQGLPRPSEGVFHKLPKAPGGFQELPEASEGFQAFQGLP